MNYENDTEDDVEDDVATGVRYWFPCVDDLLLEFVEEGIVLLSLYSIGLGLMFVLPLVGSLILILHLKFYKLIQ